MATISKLPPQEPEEAAPEVSTPVVGGVKLALEAPSSAVSQALEAAIPCPHGIPSPAVWECQEDLQVPG